MRAMAYPAKLLADGERIDFEMRPHWRSMVVPDDRPAGDGRRRRLPRRQGAGQRRRRRASRWVVVIVAVILLVGWFVRPLLAWLTTQYVFTDRRIITRTGHRRPPRSRHAAVEGQRRLVPLHA